MSGLLNVRHACFLGFALTFCANGLSAPAVLSEFMYHSPFGNRFEYVEIASTGGEVSLAGWSLSGGVSYRFEAGSVIPAGGRIVVCADVEAFLSAYPDLDPSLVYGPYEGDLENAGELVMLQNARGAVVDSVRYDDDAPWDFLADGFGPSIERVCLTASGSDPNNWRAGPVPSSDLLYGGSPLEAPDFAQCPPPEVQRPAVRITEIMYHPVMEQDYEDRHEFIEIANADSVPVNLAGWRFVGGIDFTFPDRTLQPGEYLVVAFDRQALLEVKEYDLDPNQVIGDYGAPDPQGNVRSLDNGGEKIGLVSAEGVGIDSVTYDDDWPWPTGADALGAGRAWLPSEWLPLEQHQYRGRSLERVSLNWPSNDLANWVASPLDGPTPGRPNAGARTEPLPVVEDIDCTPEPPHPDDELLRAEDDVKITVRFSRHGQVSDVAIEYFIEDVARSNEPREILQANDAGVPPDQFAGDRVFTALFPKHPDRTIVRYRILADRGQGQEVVSPRPSDPFRWHAFYISPRIEGRTRAYEIFISPAQWGRMWTNIQAGRVPGGGCNRPNPTWDSKVPCIFVYKGKVYDVFARYQGSRWNRRNGPDISSARWPYPRPSTGPLKALSWHINFPRYDEMEGWPGQVGGLRIIILNKLTQTCPGLTSGAGYRFFEEVGIPVPRQRFVRLYINGGYYRYMQEMERIGETLIRRWIRERRKEDPSFREEVGHLFKSVGCNCDEGPYGWGDERRLPARCGYSALERYEWTYDPKTHEWAGAQLVMDLIEQLNDARAAGVDAVRQFFIANFDMEMLTDYICIINWAVPFDDMFQNHFLYRRTSDHKWFMIPWDLDRDFGFWQGPNSSIYMGEQGDPSNRQGWWNYLKDAYLKAFRAEYEERLRELNETLLTPEKMNEYLDRVLAEADPGEANQAAAPMSCSFSSAASTMRNFAVVRQRVVRQAIPKIVADAGPDLRVFAGEEVFFDARASRPDPAPGVEYRWSNGMNGDYPSFVFEEPGEYTITLTIVYDGDSASDSVKVTVLPRPEWAFLEQEGRVVIEAESYHMNLAHGENDAWWTEETARSGYSGSAYMHAAYNVRRTFYSNYTDRSPELLYIIQFSDPGTYYIWVRSLCESTSWDSLHVGLDGVGRTGDWSLRFQVLEDTWQWSNNTRSRGPLRVDVSKAGLHTLSLWIRESGVHIDKIILTKDSTYRPEGLGPAESPQVSLIGEGAFIRGDVNGDRRIDISDAVTILRFLFAALQIPCEDTADVNDDGALNVADTIYLLQYLFLNGGPPAAPFPSAGYDQTPDPWSCGDKPSG